MPRPTTTTAATAAAILASVAVSAAVSGCMSVEQPPEAAPSAVTGPPPAPRTDGKNRPRLVQAPAREALERMGPPRRPSPRQASSWQTETGTKPPGPPHSHDRPAPAPPSPPAAPVRRPAPARPDAGAPRPAPPTVPAPPVADVCALGEAYGNWDPHSPQAVICRNTYGR
ncbi:hypothetical protein ACH4D5_37010 [Streptomyces sp. NPDC018029]|uniref:hypothetical protein n=1 Tax=Streptomyces sp. NPDC018029 TaxID=3365032 RepID=UPI0037B02B83